MTQSANERPMRRSPRRTLEVPIRISGKDIEDRPFEENSQTLVVSNHGALILTRHQLAIGTELVLANPTLGRTGKATVVWPGPKRGPNGPYEVGVQLVEGETIPW